MGAKKGPPGKSAEGDRLYLLRRALGWTQDDVSERSMGQLTRVEVSNAENARNQLSTVNFRTGLSTAFGLPAGELFAYLEGQGTPDGVKARCKPPPRADAPGPLPPGVKGVSPTAEAFEAALPILLHRRITEAMARTILPHVRLPASLAGDGLAVADAVTIKAREPSWWAELAASRAAPK